VRAAGGTVWTLDGSEPRFNRERPKFRGLLAAPAGLEQPIREFLGEVIAGMSG
jgi:hypothetical protein